MRKFILPVLLLHLAMAVNAATYYFSSSSGDDARTSAQAQNSSTPWKSVSKLNTMMATLRPGDQVLFKRGETFSGGIVVTVSGNSAAPITFGAYGTGNKPIISGFSVAANWAPVRANVWEAPFWQPAGSESMVVMNNQQQAIGRYPNKAATNGGYLVIDSHSGSTQLTSRQLPSSPNWTGADVVIRKNRWILDRSTVTAHSGTTLNFVSASTNDITDKFGFFIENSTNTLDQNGEWYYDRSRTKLQMYFSANNPNAYSVKASTVETLATLSFVNYISFSNLAFEGANSYAFNLTNCSNIGIDACSINYTGIDAIKGLSSGYVRLSNTVINNANNGGVNFYWNCSNNVITNDTIKNTAAIAGMGQSGNGTHQGIYLRGDYNLIQNSEIDSSGANGIHFEGNYSTVTRCFVNTFGFTIDDCGGIYTGQGLGDNTTYNSKSIIDNVVLNGIGSTGGTDDTTYVAAVGIYLDDNSNHVAVLRNTVANCAHTGIFNHNSTYTDIESNTIYNCNNEQFLAVRSINPVSEVTFKNNICFSKTATQLASRIESYYGNNNLPQLGNFTGNYYCRPIDTSYMFYSMYQTGGSYYTSYETIDSWQSKYGLDGGSASSPASIPAFSYSNASGVNVYPNGGYNTNIWNVSKFASTGDIATTWLANKLDAGTLQVSANSYTSSNNFYITLPTDQTVTAGQQYMLTFTLQGAQKGSPMTVYLRRQDSPNSDLTPRTIIPVQTSRGDYSFAFTPNQTARVSIELDVAQPKSQLWIDNVMLQSATTKPTDPDDYIFFAYNAGNSNKQVTVPSGSYMDATGKAYNGNVTLKPYTSLLVFNADGVSGKKVVGQPQAIAANGSLSDAASSAVSAPIANLSWQVANQSSEASYYNIERSPDAQTFTEVGKASAKKSGDAATAYTFTDATPQAGKNYYRITQFDAKGTAAISQMVMVNNISFRINPNPAKDVIHLMFDQAINANDHLDKDISIRNTAGITVQTVQLPSTSNLSKVDINVSFLPRGLYILSATSEGKTFSRKFIKE